MFQKVFEYAGPHKKGLYAAPFPTQLIPFREMKVASQ